MTNTVISPANAGQPASPTARAASTACRTAAATSATRPSGRGGRARAAIRARSAPQTSRKAG